MSLDPKLRSPRERKLFVVGAVLSSLAWAALVLSVVGLVYGLFIGLFVVVAHGLFLAHVRGNGVRLSERQLPDLHARVVEAARRLGLAAPPEAYVVQSGGILNAFATRFFSREFVILNSELLDQCSDARQLDFVVGHEVGHLAAGHLRWRAFLAPFAIVPWLGAAYSRAREYTCDRCGLAVAGDLEQSMRALLVLAGGGRVAREAALAPFTAQREETGGFWMAVLELSSSHPYLCKRAAALEQLSSPAAVAAPPRSALAWVLSPVLAGAAGGPAAAPLVMVAIVGVLAAIAIPNFVKYQERAKAARAGVPAADAFAPEAGEAPAGAALSAEDRAALEWVRQVRQQVEAQDRAESAQPDPGR